MSPNEACTKLTPSRLRPHLLVRDAGRAIAWYVEVLGARELARYTDRRLGRIVHAELILGDAVFTLADEHVEYQNVAPPTLGGTPVVLTLHVDDADAVGARMQAGDAEVVFPIADQFYGERQGAGWVAHALEQYDQSPFMRARVDYTGSRPPR